VGCDIYVYPANMALISAGAKRLVCFLDDLNTCAVDKYGTQQPVAFLRQHLDYGFWYDRKKLAANEVSTAAGVELFLPGTRFGVEG
jgi:hypothetical protein